MTSRLAGHFLRGVKYIATKKRAQKDDADKRLIKLYSDYQTLRAQKGNLGWEPLFPPKQHGWKRFFILRPDVALSRHADFFAGILEKINTVGYHPRKDFLTRKKGKNKRWRKFVVKPQQLKLLHRSEFEKLADNEKQFFHAQTRIESWSRVPVVYYAFTEPWRFVLRVRPNIVDKVRVRDSELDMQIRGIWRYLDRNNLNGKMWRLLIGHAYRYIGPNVRYRYPYKHWPVQKIIDATKEEIYNE